MTEPTLSLGEPRSSGGRTLALPRPPSVWSAVEAAQ